MKNKLKYILVGVVIFMFCTTGVLADTAVTDCEVLISPELRELIDKYMTWIRILVPLVLIVLCMMDLGKAVMAFKEDEMKKVKSTVIKRLIIGVVIFFVPTIVNFTINFADTYFDANIFKNGTCGIE